MKLSIILVCFNHEEYIEEALNSIFMQEINFSYEIIVADDCSKDDTLLVIKNFELLYPDKIKILSSSRNLGITKNYQRAFEACLGDYIAILEGDDYWISPKKLSKQINFLETHRESSFCFHRFIGYDQKKQNFFPSLKISGDDKNITTKDLIRENFIGNFSTCMYRKEIILQIAHNLYDLVVYDWMFNIVNSQYGNIGYLPEFLSVYRIHEDGEWSKKNQSNKIEELKNCIDHYNKFLDYKFDVEFENLRRNLGSKFSLFSKEGLTLITPPLILTILRGICPPIIIKIIKRYFFGK